MMTYHNENNLGCQVEDDFSQKFGYHCYPLLKLLPLLPLLPMAKTATLQPQLLMLPYWYPLSDIKKICTIYKETWGSKVGAV